MTSAPNPVRDIMRWGERAHGETPDDSYGWYILEYVGGGFGLRHWTRYNHQEAANSQAKFLFSGFTGNLYVGRWSDGWERETFAKVA